VVARLGDLREGQAAEVGDRVAGDLDPDGVDDDDAADARRSGQRHLGGDPPADGVAGHGHIIEAELVEQGDVDRGEPADAVQAFRPGGAAEPGVGRYEHAHVPGGGELVREGGDRLGPGAAVQEEEGVPLAAVAEADLDLAGLLGADGDGVRGGHGAPC
jgi:hypothetical protein